ncbi:uncharacterized protein LOC129758420 isoform X2 [Uranotaenia lowii]|uniref:uncharacterized protein LOC129758420 isoform X2 n=1 Tax=Uranotaenia lowii TaxID=190385 RepID=UPI00247A12B1|nr:uncharacterized protein LOC129758420 isoform X2 [Uranotaenia lowii]
MLICSKMFKSHNEESTFFIKAINVMENVFDTLIITLFCIECLHYRRAIQAFLNDVATVLNKFKPKIDTLIISSVKYALATVIVLLSIQVILTAKMVYGEEFLDALLTIFTLNIPLTLSTVLVIQYCFFASLILLSIKEIRFTLNCYLNPQITDIVGSHDKMLQHVPDIDSIRRTHMSVSLLLDHLHRLVGIVLIVFLAGTFVNFNIDFLDIYRLFNSERATFWLNVELMGFMVLRIGKAFMIVVPNTLIKKENQQISIILCKLSEKDVMRSSDSIDKFFRQLTELSNVQWICGTIELGMPLLVAVDAEPPYHLHDRSYAI